MNVSTPIISSNKIRVLIDWINGDNDGDEYAVRIWDPVSCCWAEVCERIHI